MPWVQSIPVSSPLYDRGSPAILPGFSVVPTAQYNCHTSKPRLPRSNLIESDNSVGQLADLTKGAYSYKFSTSCWAEMKFHLIMPTLRDLLQAQAQPL